MAEYMGISKDTVARIWKDHGLKPWKLDTFKVSTDLEALRLLMMASNNLCSNAHCTQVFGDLASGIAQLAPLNASIPVPSLHDLCAKIPQVAVVPPVTAPAAPAAAKP